MSVESGKGGNLKIAGVAALEIMQWSFNKTVVSSRYRSNTSAGYMNSIAGGYEGSGSITFKVDTTTPGTGGSFREGSSATLQLFVNATKGYVVPCIITRCALTVDINSTEAIEGTLDFDSHGAWTEYNTIS